MIKNMASILWVGFLVTLVCVVSRGLHNSIPPEVIRQDGIIARHKAETPDHIVYQLENFRYRRCLLADPYWDRYNKLEVKIPKRDTAYKKTLSFGLYSTEGKLLSNKEITLPVPAKTS